jgi:hypothetical protein
MIAFPITLRVAGHALQGLLVNAPDSSHHPMEWLADYLYRQHPSDLAVASFVIVRPPVDQPMQEHHFRARALPILRQRLPSLPIYLLGSQNFLHFLSANLNTLVDDPLYEAEREIILVEIRQEELAMYAYHSNALLRTTGNRFFLAPSKRYCQHFMRVGNIQTSRSAIDAVFFWLLPWLKDCSAIIAESWTVSSTAINAARLLSRYDPHRHSRCRVDMLSAYHENATSLHAEAEDIFRRVLPLPSDKVLLLVSSCMSGNLIGQFREMFRTAGFNDSRWTSGTIYSLSQAHDVPSLCDATRLVPDGAFGFSEIIPDNASIIEIDRRTYFPLRIEQNKINLKRDQAAKFKDFFNAYRKTGLFCVHRNCYEHKGGTSRYLRHHAIDLDIGAILECEPFASKFRESVLKIHPAPKVIIAPPHQAGIKMSAIAERLLKINGHAVEQLIHPDLKLLESDPWRRRFCDFPSDESVLVIDDVSVTGSRLASFAQSLRAMDFKGQVHFRVGIARPESEKHWKKVCGQLCTPRDGKRHTIEAMHEVVLPNWHRRMCPWCIEQRFYTDALSKLETFDERLSGRLSLLSADDSSDPLTNSIFFTDQQMPFPNLAMESLFVDEGATQAALFAAVASLIQRMRVSEATPEMPPPNYPEVSVIDPGNYLLADRFPEASIRASILRALTIGELQAPRNEDEILRADAAKNALFNDELAKPLALEVLLQSKLGKLPQLRLTPLQADELRQRYKQTAELLLGKAEMEKP